MTTPRALLGGLLLAGALVGCGRGAVPSRQTGVETSLLRLEGGRTSLAAWRGQVLVVTFFATWSLPAVAEVPILNTLHAEPGVTVVAVGLDEEGGRTLAPFADTFEVRYPIFLPSEEVRRGESAFGPISVVPTTFILDPRGRPVEGVQGMLDPEAALRLVRSIRDRGR